MTTEKYDHELYKHVKDIEKADAVAFTNVNPEKQVFFPYKQPILGDDEIRANVLYCGLCQSDVHSVRELWFKGMYYPLTPGHEIVAQVSEFGKNVKGFKKGETVAFGTIRNSCKNCKNCSESLENICLNTPMFGKEEKLTYGYHWGGYSTQIQQPAYFFYKLKENVKLNLVAPLLCAGITVYNPISQYAKPGMKTAVVGIGGLGHLALQILNKMGIEVDALTTSTNNSQLYKDLGATNVVNMKDKDDLAKYLNKYDLLLNTSPSGKTMNTLLDLINTRGTLCQIGAPSADDTIEISPFALISKEIRIVGSSVGGKKITQEMLDFCIEKDIYPMCEEFSFEDFPKAFEKLEKGKPRFRCVVNIGEYAKKNNLVK